MTQRKAFDIWSMTADIWSGWVRPVAFVTPINKMCATLKLNIPPANYANELSPDTAIILDLPDNDAIEEGIALAKLGWALVPLYNGTDPCEGTTAIIDNSIIKSSLILAAEQLASIKPRQSPPPAFLLDSNRTNRYKMDVSVFDNSWDIYTQDMPSAEFLIKNGITKIVLRAEKIQRDLNIILYKYQQKGIKIFLSQMFETAKEIVVKKPSRKALKAY